MYIYVLCMSVYPCFMVANLRYIRIVTMIHDIKDKAKPLMFDKFIFHVSHIYVTN